MESQYQAINIHAGEACEQTANTLNSGLVQTSSQFPMSWLNKNSLYCCWNKTLLAETVWSFSFYKRF